MNYTTEQIEKINQNIQKIVAYIEDNILPYINHTYETPEFGPIETWGRMNEHRGQRYYIALNGPYATKIRFYHGPICWNAKDIAYQATESALQFLKYWQDAKMYMNTEIANNKENLEVINNFEV